MGITSQEPDPGRKGGNRQWNYLSVKNGTTTCGFLAGHPFGVFCHHTHGSKPCKIRVTDGALPCRFCSPDCPPVWRGYTPIWSREYVPLFCIITEDYLEAVREIPVGSQVKISRGNRVYDPVIIRAELWRASPLPPSKDREQSIDLLPTLVRMWKDAELTKWHGDTRAPVASVAAVTVPEGVPVELVNRVKEHKARTAAEVEEKIDEVMSPLTFGGKPLVRAKPSENGKHKPPDG